MENVVSAYDYYRLFMPDSFAEEVVYQSKLYAVQKNYPKKQLDCLSLDTYRCTEAMLLHSGYHTVPRRRMLWEKKKDCHNDLVAEAVRRDEVDAVLKCLHFRDNSKIDNDGYYKVRPIFNQLNKGARFNLDSMEYSVDEVMIPYFGRHGTKQFIYGKPVRYGFKVPVLY